MVALAGLLVLTCGIIAFLSLPADPDDPNTFSALDTQVAQTVEAARAQNTATAAVVASPTSTVALATSTAGPSPTPSETPMPSPTATATLASEDPRVLLGEPDWRDAFNNGANWTLDNGSVLRTDVQDGYFLLTMKPINNGTWWVISWPEIKDFYLEATAITPSECVDEDRYGLFFRSPDENRGFFLSFSCNGQFRLAKSTGSTTDTDILIDWTESSAIFAGPNQTNRIGVRAVGNTIKLYANGILLAEYTDGDYKDANRFGFNIGADKTENFTVKFDEIAYWIIE